MKILLIVFTSLLFCFSGINFVQTQEKSKKDKAKNNPSASQQMIEVKANLMVLEADGKFADIKPEDLKIYEDGVEQKITYFVKKENALNVGLVMDNTGSMRPHLDTITKTGATFVNNLRPQDETFVVRFVASENVEMLQDWTTNKRLMNTALENLFIEGGQSAVIDGLYLAADKIRQREKVDKSKRGAVILVSDGEDRDSFYKQEDLFELLKDSDIQIFIIGLTQELSDRKNDMGKRNSKTNAENFLKSLALKTGGAAFILQGGKTEIETALVQSLKSILTELNSQYIIGYTSTNQKRDGSARKLTVQVADGGNGAKRQTFVRESFVVPEEKIK